MYALADCNNFFVSCERVFRPDIEGQPVVVLSNNDGCVISRSNEAKALGIPMGVPLYQIRELVESGRITCFSSNHSLYSDLSARVMSILRSYTTHFEQYSIDEAFMWFPNTNETQSNDVNQIASKQKLSCERIVKLIRQGVGIPISIGLAPTKTLAKVACRFAKKHKGYHGVCEIHSEAQRRKALACLEIGDVWGIGNKARAKLESAGIHTALQFADQLPEFAQNILHKTGLMTWQELNGHDVINSIESLEKQSITTSRTFATAITDLTCLEQQIANFCDNSARQLRMQHSVCQQMIVYAHTSRFRTDIEPQYISETITLPVATSSTQELLHYALLSLRKSFRPSTFYKKAGIVLLKIQPETAIVQDLFDQRDRNKDTRLQRTLDTINNRHGKRAIVFGPQSNATNGTACEANMSTYKKEHKSPFYTTDIHEIITLKA